MIEKLGPYRIERLLGRGGMGAVYAGVHESTQQKVAVKVLSTAIADDPRFRSRFLAEVETLKKLRHPHIVQLFGWGEQEGELFYSMELVEGRSLQDEMKNGRYFHWQEVVQFAIDICAALKHAHDSGVIHRDLKPANLLLKNENQIKLTDFGIAKLFGAVNITAEGSVIGTADYMAPEQAEGQAVSNRTDLYSLGAVMFTLLARRTPFSRPSLPQIIHSLRYDAAPSVREFAPKIPSELEVIISQLLQKLPADRIATALVLSNRLKAMQHALGGSTRIEEPPSFASQVDGEAPTLMPLTAESGRFASASEPTSSDSPMESDRDHSAVPASSDSTIVSKPTSSSSTKSDSTRADSPSSTHFTTVGDERRSAWRSSNHPDASRVERWTIVAVVAVILLLGAFSIGLIAFQNSADTMYARIRTAAEANRTEDVKDVIDDFLTRYPTDPRFNEVDDWRRDIESGWLKSRLVLRQVSSGGTGLEPYEKSFLEGMSSRESKPDEAIKKFQTLVDEYGTDSVSGDATKYVAAAQHQLKRLKKTGS